MNGKYKYPSKDSILMLAQELKLRNISDKNYKINHYSQHKSIYDQSFYQANSVFIFFV